MSQPKKRKPSSHSNTPKLQRGIIYHKIIPVAVVIFLLFGTGIAYFAAGPDVKWLVAGAVTGGLSGFLFGYQVAKGLSKK